MLAKTLTATPWGVEARPVQVEVDVHAGQLPGLQIVGLADAAVRESRERVRRAIRNSGFLLHARVVVVNLAPADLRKEGNHLDLAIGLALLAAHDKLPQEALDGRLVAGELGLDGSVRPVRGGLAIAELGARLGVREVLLPTATAGEAAALGNVPVVPIASFRDAVGHLTGENPIPPAAPDLTATQQKPGVGEDLADVRGQFAARRALEVAAAGGHNLLLIGPPGSGKTMLARRLPGLLPPLTTTEAIAVTKIHSLTADEALPGLLRQRPFRNPDPSISTAALVGGGSLPRPGEVSLAHHGVLFLDELPEFRRDALEALRGPLETAEVVVVRTRARLRFPARFTLAAAMNPCPCGHLGDARHECRCTPKRIETYRGRISGPLLDRIDLHVEVPALGITDLQGRGGEPTAAVAARVAQARQVQLERFGRDATSPTNAAMSAEELNRHCELNPASRRLLDQAFERLGLSARALHRVLKVARTLADLAGSTSIQPHHIAEAIQYRTLDRRTTL